MRCEQNIIKSLKSILLGACSLLMLISRKWNYVNCLAGVAIRYIYEYKLEVIIVMLVLSLRKKAEYKKEFSNETQILLKCTLYEEVGNF